MIFNFTFFLQSVSLNTKVGLQIQMKALLLYFILKKIQLNLFLYI